VERENRRSLSPSREAVLGEDFSFLRRKTAVGVSLPRTALGGLSDGFLRFSSFLFRALFGQARLDRVSIPPLRLLVAGTLSFCLAYEELITFSLRAGKSAGFFFSPVRAAREQPPLKTVEIGLDKPIAIPSVFYFK